MRVGGGRGCNRGGSSRRSHRGHGTRTHRGHRQGRRRRCNRQSEDTFSTAPQNVRETHVPDVPRASDPSRFPTQTTHRPSSGRGQGLNILRDIISGIIQQQPATQPNQPVQTTQPSSNPVATFIPPNGNSNNNPVSFR